MPERSTKLSPVRFCGDESIDAGRGPGQLGWYEFASRFVEGRSVLDVGCGIGKGLDILANSAANAEGQDLDVRLARENVRIGPLEAISNKSYDVVVSIDVVEHVEDPSSFLGQLNRIARKGMFLTTPNWTASRCKWPFHLREYTPKEFYEELCRHGIVTLFKGTSDGSEVYPIEHPGVYFLQNRLRVHPMTALPTRCLNVILPPHFRIHSSNAAWVSLE